MPPKVPPLEETKAIILKAKGAAWLKEQEAKFDKSYGKSVKDPSMRMWLIGKQNDLPVLDIKANSEGLEGEPVVIQDIIEKAKAPEEQGWTKMNEGKFEQPDSQAKYSLLCVVLDMEEGITTTKKPKLDLVVADGTGIAKVVAYADAAQLFVEAKVKRGSVIKLPLTNVQYGHHNFGREPNQVWWKFAVPPFGEVQSLDKDPREFFLNVDEDAVKENKPAMIMGFIVHVEERTNETCKVCRRWVTERNPHEACRQDDNFDVTTETVWQGTCVSTAGQTTKLQFKSKPKVKMATDLVEIFGRMNKMNAIDVSFIRRAGSTDIETPVTAAMAAKPAVKVVPKKPAPAPEPEPEPEPETEEEEESEPAPPPKKIVKAAKKPAPEPPAVEEADEEPAEEEEVPEPVVEVRKAAKSPPAAKKASAPQATVQVSVGEVPEEIVKHVEKACKQFGGKNFTFVLTRQAQQHGLLGDGGAEEQKAIMDGYIEAMVEGGQIEWTSPAKREVKWVA